MKRASKRRAAPLEVRAPPDLRVHRFDVGSDAYAVFEVPLPSSKPIDWPPELSASERDVTLLVFQGKANAEIAAARGTAVRTIANQMASIFAKLGVSSRAELCVLGSNRWERRAIASEGSLPRGPRGRGRG